MRPPLPATGAPSDLRLAGDLLILLLPAAGMAALLLTARHLARLPALRPTRRRRLVLRAIRLRRSLRNRWADSVSSFLAR